MNSQSSFPRRRVAPRTLIAPPAAALLLAFLRAGREAGAAGGSPAPPHFGEGDRTWSPAERGGGGVGEAGTAFHPLLPRRTPSPAGGRRGGARAPGPGLAGPLGTPFPTSLGRGHQNSQPSGPAPGRHSTGKAPGAVPSTRDGNGGGWRARGRSHEDRPVSRKLTPVPARRSRHVPAAGAASLRNAARVKLRGAIPPPRPGLLRFPPASRPGPRRGPACASIPAAGSARRPGRGTATQGRARHVRQASRPPPPAGQTGAGWPLRL